jgi:trimeric autotransporter adhesin
MFMKKRIGNPQKVHGQVKEQNASLAPDRRSLYTGFKFVWLLVAIVLTNSLLAQNVAINADGSKPNQNAMLDIKSSTKGLLIPRMTTDARLRIEPTQGLMVYDVNTNSFWYNNGKNWLSLASSAEAMAVDPSAAWIVTGNAGTVDGVNFIGTTDNAAFNVRVNNLRSGRIDPSLENTFWGYKAGNAAPTGKHNTGIGASALLGTTSGFDNTAVGSYAMFNNTVGFSNTALGRLALQGNTNGNYNVAIGQAALSSNTTGSENVAVGTGALIANGTYRANTAVGTNALFFVNGS